jgi:hypothetical protein
VSTFQQLSRSYPKTSQFQEEKSLMTAPFPTTCGARVVLMADCKTRRQFVAGERARMASIVAFVVSAWLIRHHQGVSITSPTTTVIFLSSFHVYFWLAVFFIRSPWSGTSPANSQATIFQVIQTHSCQLLLNKRERTTPNNCSALAVWFISTLLWGATVFCFS